MHPKSQVFAADLLEALDALPPEFHHAAAQAAGFRFDPPRDDHAEDGRTLEITLPAGKAKDDAEASAQPGASQSSGQVFWRVESMHQEDEPATAPEVPAWLQQSDDFNPARFVSPPRRPNERRADDWVPLVSEERFASFLGAHLKPWIGGGEPDMPKVVSRLAAARPLHPWPAVERRRWPGLVHVVIDLSSALTPFRADLLHLLRLIQRQLGPSRVRVVCTETGEPGRWCEGQGLVGDVPRDGGAVVVLGDAGIYRRGAELDRRWVSFARSLGLAGGRPLLLAPVPPGQVPAAVREAFEVVLLDQGQPLRQMLRPVGREAADPLAVEARRQRGTDLLRAALFGNSHVRWPLVRQLRRVLQRAGEPVDIGTEAMLWQDDGVCVTSTACALAADHVEMARAELITLMHRDAATLDALVRSHWQVLAEASPLLRALYASEWSQPDLRVADTGLAQALRDGQDEGDRLIQAAARRLWQPAATVAQCDLQDGLADFLGTLDQRSVGAIGRGGTAVQVAWSVANAEGLREGRLAVPEGLDAEVLGWLLPEGDVPLVRKVHLCLVSEPAPPPGTGSVVRLELRPDEADVPLSLATFRTRASHAVVTSLDGSAAGVGRAVVIDGGGSIGVESDGRYRVQAGGVDVVVKPFTKPDWADALWFEDQEWRAQLPGGRQLGWTPKWYDVPLRSACWWDLADRHPPESSRWASRRGQDSHGFWAEFTVKGRRGLVTQRMRWIPPGEFVMGSPEDEEGRSNDERQHLVLLTQGYWLADTACTQELWEAVMGENPSRFKDYPQNPVEQVSWNDITQKFLPRLNRLVPGLNLTLPTEAQWEYACRAGTTTVFSFGDEIWWKQVNYDSNHTYVSGEKSELRNKTVSVKKLPANQWGLHQMHGNTLEWCQDGLAAYPEGTSIDPVVHQDRKEDRRRVLRGGSCLSNGRNCRSACRDALAPVVRDDDMGFRLARGLAEQPAGNFGFGQPEAGGADAPGISRSSESEASPPKAAKNVKNSVFTRFKKWVGFGQEDQS
jgi:formylglycine-generating enzyme required for sulfatase activity